MQDKTPADTSPSSIAWRSPVGLLAFGFGSGLSPLAPGTMGTLVAIPFAIGLKSLGSPLFWLAVAVLFLAGILICGHACRMLGVHDHAGIVWDEMVGYWLAVAFVPMQWPWWLAAFLLFRFFDIVKPWPIRQLDKSITGGFGVMVDDVLAALYAVVVLELVQLLW